MTVLVIADPTGGSLPSAERLDDVLHLLDELAELDQAVDGLTRRLEVVSGLRTGELQALAAVSAGAAHPRAVARRIGQVDDAGRATVEALVRRGLLRRRRHPASPAGDTPLVQLTEAGRGVLAQAQGLRIRALTALVQQLGDAGARSLRSTVRAVGAALAVDPMVPGRRLTRDTGSSGTPLHPRSGTTAARRR